MRIGLTYDLKAEYLAQGLSPEAVAEFDSEDTIAGLEGALRRLGHEPQRIGSLKALLPRLHAGERWDMVFNICEGLKGIGREAQVPAILEAFDIPYTFSDPAVLTVCLHKGWTKAVLAAAQVPTAPFAVLEPNDQSWAAFAFPYPVFVKPVAEGTGKGIGPASIVRQPTELAGAISRLWHQFQQPVLVEPFLPGREFTVGVTGEGETAQAEGCLEIHLRATAEQGVYSYANKADYQTHVDYRLCKDDMAKEAMRIALAAYRALGCRDAGRADLRADAQGRVMVLEMNPLAGLNPIDSDLPILWRQLGRNYDDLIGTIIGHARRRIRPDIA